jgi:hypothetical protein
MTAAYALAALLALRSGRSAEARDRGLWFLVAGMLLLLSLAKQIQLLGHVTGAIRSVFMAKHWYGDHHEVQMAFAAVVGLAFIGSGWLLAHRLRGVRASLKAAMAALLLLLAFLAIRATSIHAIDEWVTFDLAGMRKGWWAELLALAAISAAALAYTGPNRPRAADAQADRV